MTKISEQKDFRSAKPDSTASVKFDKRVHESLVASSELRLLSAISVRLPQWATPNRLTAFGLFGAFVILAGYVLSWESLNWLWLANLGLVLHWLGDSLDGTVARLRRIERPRFGFYIDQVVDTICSLIIAVGVGISPFARLDLSLLVLAVFSMLTMQTYVRTIVDREFHIAVGRLGPTELRLGIIGMNIGVLLLGARPIKGLHGTMNWVDIAMLVTSAGLLVMLLLQMRRHLVRLSVEDPPPGNRDG